MLRKYAVTEILSAQIAPQGGAAGLRRMAHRHSFEYEPRPGYLYVRSRAISSRTNDNFDTFPAEEIKKAYTSFIGKPVFVNHNNDNHRRARGVVIDAALHEDKNPDGSPDTWAEVLMEVDAVRFPKLAKAILAGHIDRTSMGTDVKFSVCSVCNNKASTPLEYCSHIPKLKGKRIYRTTASGKKEGVLVSEICHGLGFFENSLLVEEPADPTAYFLGVDDHSKTASRKTALPGQQTSANEASDGGDPGAPGNNATLCETCGKEIYEVEGSGWMHDIDGAAGLPHKASPIMPTMPEVQQPILPGQDPQLAQMAPQGMDPSQSGMDPSMGQPPMDPAAMQYQASMTYEAKGVAFENPGDHPSYAALGLHHQNIIDHWNACTPEEIELGKRWYSDAHHVAKAIAGGDAHKGAGVLSAYSPQTDWPKNLFNATRSFLNKKAVRPGENGVGPMTSQANAADLIMQGTHHQVALTGPKTQDFAHLIEHGGMDPETGQHSQRVVMDRHAMSVVAGRRLHTEEDAAHSTKVLSTRHYYEHAADMYRQAARHISDHLGYEVAPHQVQAATWLARQRLNGQEINAEGGRPAASYKGRQTAERNVRDKFNDLMRQHFPSHVNEQAPYNMHFNAALVYGTKEFAASDFHKTEKGKKCSRWGCDKPAVASRSVGGKQLGACAEHKAEMTKKAMLDSLFPVIAFGETMAPADVDTLRDEACPVCGEADAFDGNECSICGFVAPPKMFQDPDLDLAKQMDLRKDNFDSQQADPNGDGMPDVIPGSGAPGPDDMPMDPSQVPDPDDVAQQQVNQITDDQQPLDPAALDMNGQPINQNDMAMQEPQEQDPNAQPMDSDDVAGQPEPGTPGDDTADLVCPACGYQSPASPPESVDMNQTSPEAGAAEGAICPNCGQAALTSLKQMNEQMTSQTGQPGIPVQQGR